MKKLFTIFVALVASIGMMKADIIERVNLGDLYYDLDESSKTATVVSHENQYSGNIVVPASVEYLSPMAYYTVVSFTVKYIGKGAFQNCSGLTSIELPEGITSIGEYAFKGCTQLTSITLPNAVTTIGRNAFDGCSNIASATLGNSVKTIGRYAFSGCSSLTTITIPSTLTSIGSRPFYGCNSLTSVVWNPKTFSDFSEVYDLEDKQQYYNSPFPASVTSIVFGEGVEYIPRYMCYSMNNLKSVTLPGSLTNINASACQGRGVQEIHYTGSFEQWQNKTWNPSLISYSYDLYMGGELLSALVILEGTTTFKSSFYGCKSLTSITIPGSVTSIEGSFSNIQEIHYTGTYEQWLNKTWYSISNNYALYLGGELLTAAVIPESMTSFGEIFHGCNSLKSITISSSLESFDEGAFYGCKISEIHFVGTYEQWLNKSWSTTYMSQNYALYINGILQTTLIIPEGSTSISNYESAFTGCNSLTSIVIPEGVTRIEDYAFSGCSGITSVTIPNSVINIGYNAFYGCTNLSSITIGKNVESIGYGDYSGAFYGCNIKEIHFTGTLSEWINRTWEIWKGWYDFYDYKLYIGDVLQTEITVPEDVTRISDIAFRGCTSLTTLTISSNVTEIGDESFGNCINLTAFNVVEDHPIFSAEDGVLYNKDKIALIKYPQGKKGEFTIPNSVIYIRKYAFRDCNGLTALTIPSSVTNIGEYAFTDCSGLTSIICEAVTPPTLDSYYSIFSNVDKSIPLYVPAQSIEAYKAANGWKEFTNILPIEGEAPVGSSCDNPIIVEDDVYQSGYTMNPQGTKWYRVTNIPDIRNQNLGLTIGVKNTSMKSSNISLYYDCNQSAPFRQAELNPAWEWKINLSQEDYNQLFASGEPSLLIECTAESTCLLELETTNHCYVAHGTCGDNVTWELSCDSVLTISGTGAMADYSYQDIPWSKHYDVIKQIIVSDGVTTIGKAAFIGCTSAETITLGKDITYIGEGAMYIQLGKLETITCNAATPPTLGGDKTLSGYDNIYVPCPSLEAYKTADFWARHANFIHAIEGTCSTEPMYPIFVHLLDSGHYEYPIESAQITLDRDTILFGTWNGKYDEYLIYAHRASRNQWTLITSTTHKYTPVSWIDSQGWYKIASDTLHLIVTDTTDVWLEVVKNGYTVHLYAESYEQGSVRCNYFPYYHADTTVYASYRDTLRVEAIPNSGYEFKQWSDGFTSNPRSLTVTHDISLKAIFKPNAFRVTFLNWNGDSIAEQSVAYNQAAVAPKLPEREGYIFKGWTADIEHITARTFVIALYDKVGVEVTYKAEDGETIFSEHADLHFPDAPSITGKTFAGWLTENIDKNGIVLRATYTIDNPTANDDVTVEPGSTSANVTFPFVTGAITYVLVIRDLFGRVVCKIMFNASGRLLGIAFAPNRDRSQTSAQTDNFQFTVEGLDPSTTYEYEFIAHDETDDVIESLAGSFTTKAEIPTDFESVQPSEISIQKVVMNDQVLILRGEKAYTVTGQEVK